MVMEEILEKLKQCTGFQWDEGNSEKNWEHHRVTRAEAEQPFFNQPFIVADDSEHSMDEERLLALGKTNRNRLLFIVFTLRGSDIRIVSVRDMTKKERAVYRAP